MDVSSLLFNQQIGSWFLVVMNEMGLNELLLLFFLLLVLDVLVGMLSDVVVVLIGLFVVMLVVVGVLDVCSVVLGCGVVNEGDIYMIFGIICCIGIVCCGLQMVNEVMCFVIYIEVGQVIFLFLMQVGMLNIDWLQQYILLDVDLGCLEQVIVVVESGSGGVFWQLYFNGECVLFYSLDVWVGFFGISLYIICVELQCVVFEGLVFVIVDVLQGYLQGGELYLMGGGVVLVIWLQIIVDCIGCMVVFSVFNELSVCGVVILVVCSVVVLVEMFLLVQICYQLCF